MTASPTTSAPQPPEPSVGGRGWFVAATLVVVVAAAGGAWWFLFGGRDLLTPAPEGRPVPVAGKPYVPAEHLDAATARLASASDGRRALERDVRDVKPGEPLLVRRRETGKASTSIHGFLSVGDPAKQKDDPGVIQAVTAGFMGWLSVIVFGFILGFFVRMSGGKGTFRQALGVTSWAALLPFALGPIIKAPLILATESVFRVNIGLAALMPGGEPGSPVFQALLAYGDFLNWWGLFVLVIGFSRVFGLTRNAAITSVVLPWALLSLIPLGLSMLFM